MHIITPYDPWSPKKKKTWQEELWEQNQIAEIEAQILAEASSKSLPENSPAIAAATVGGMANTMTGGGGKPPPQFFNPQSAQANFDRSPTTAAAPARVQFTNLTPNPSLYTFNWLFSDGQTSTAVSPSILFNTGSTAGYGLTASLAMSGSNGAPGTRSPDVYFVLTPPTVTSRFTMVSSSKTAPSTFTFTNTTTNTSQIPSTNYLWLFGSSSLANSSSVLETPPTFIYTKAGAYTASLQATGSYAVTSLYTQSFVLT